MLMLGDAMSIFARSTCVPSANSPARIPAEEVEFSSTPRVRVRRVGAGLGERATMGADLVGRVRVDERLAAADQALGVEIERS